MTGQTELNLRYAVRISRQPGRIKDSVSIGDTFNSAVGNLLNENLWTWKREARVTGAEIITQLFPRSGTFSIEIKSPIRGVIHTIHGTVWRYRKTKCGKCGRGGLKDIARCRACLREESQAQCP